MTISWLKSLRSEPLTNIITLAWTSRSRHLPSMNIEDGSALINFPETDNRLDALWRMYSDNVAQSRQHENERAAIVGVIFTIGAVLIGLITFDGAIAGWNDAAVALFLLATGIFGAGFSYKNHERSQFHFQRARIFRNRIDRDYCDNEIAMLHREADEKHKVKFGKVRGLRLHRWWIVMTLTVGVVALILLVVALAFPMHA